MTSSEEDEILDILTRDDIEIPELGIRTSRRGDLAAFWDGFRAGQRGEPTGDVTIYDEPSVYRRAHARGVISRKELT